MLVKRAPRMYIISEKCYAAEKSILEMKGAIAMLKEIMINLLIAGGVCKVHDWLTKPADTGTAQHQG